MRIWRTIVGFAFASTVLLGCATIQNDPVNVPGTPDTLANGSALGSRKTPLKMTW
jgi:hypothetical protein